MQSTARSNFAKGTSATLINYLEMVPRGLEPRTLRLLAVRSNQLSYETSANFGRLVLFMTSRALL